MEKQNSLATTESQEDISKEAESAESAAAEEAKDAETKAMPSEEPIAQPTEAPKDEQPAGEAGEKSAEGNGEKPAEAPKDEPPTEAPEEAVEKPTEEAGEKHAEEASEKPAEGTGENTAEESVAVPSEEPKKKRSFKWLIAVAIILALVGGTYGAGFAYSKSKFLPNTYLYDPAKDATVDVSNLDANQVKELLADSSPEITITQKDCLSGEPITETLNLDQMIGASMSYDTEALIENQDHQKWFMSFFDERTIEKPKAKSEFDPALLKRAIDKLYCMQKGHNIEAKNAYIKESIKDGEASYAIVPAVEGAKIDKDTAIERIQEAVDEVLTGKGDEAVDLTDLYELPEVREDDPNLNKTFKNITDIMKKTITVYPNGWAVETISGEDLRNLLVMDEEGFTVNEEALDEYVDLISSWYSISRFSYVDPVSLKEKLEDSLLSTKDVEITADWVEIVPEPKGKSNSPSIIEISIGDQYLWYYEYGKLILSTPVVTGNPNAGSKATFLGTNYVRTKARNIRLKSDDKDDPYDVKVAYWIGIDGSGYYGIHDADWRSYFGGDIYTYNPSHGCINVPVDVAAQLYNLVRIGETDVYIYW